VAGTVVIGDVVRLHAALMPRETGDGALASGQAH
jgi:hypothetical protein